VTVLTLAVALVAATSAQRVYVRVNQVGYLPDAPKAAVVCALDSVTVTSLELRNLAGDRVFTSSRVLAGDSWGACARAYRLDFSGFRSEGRYQIGVVLDGGDIALSPPIRIDRNAYAGAADTLLYYMRQQRSGYNPVFNRWVHTKDGIVVDDSARAGEFVNVTGGWADAADYLQYVATSAHATFMLMMAYRDHPNAFADKFDAWGRPGANGTADVLDEARHGLEWLVRMYADGRVFNQLGDDRDHSFWDLPYTDSSDYGWGKGGFRPVYPCTGKPQGLFAHKNRSTGIASTAGKYASVFALAAQLYDRRDPEFARAMRERAIAAYEIGVKNPGVCQTAPARSPYFYEEDNWADDMELAAVELYALTRDERYVADAHRYATLEPVTPWMGADTARHYQWFPWHNNGHYEAWRSITSAREAVAGFYRTGLERVVARADNAFRVGIPFIWCSNNLMASFATQALLYRRMTGDTRFREYEQAAIDWLLGVNPWGVSMIVGFPASGVTPRDPHSVVANRLGVKYQLGSLVDGPVYRSIFSNLRGIRLIEPDEYAAFNNGRIVYHDDLGDYSTNEPIMDGTANLAYLVAAYSAGRIAEPVGRVADSRQFLHTATKLDH
jgi:endoglucanase